MSYLSLGQKSGTLCDDHPEWIGTWIYDKSVPLGAEIRVIFTHMRKFYEEVTEFGDGTIPSTWKTAAEAEASGLEFRDAAEFEVLIQYAGDPEGLDSVKAPGGRNFLRARWTVRSSAYGRTVKILMKDYTGWLKGDLASGYYRIVTEKKTGNGNSWHVPIMKADGAVEQDVRGLLASEFGV